MASPTARTKRISSARSPRRRRRRSPARSRLAPPTPPSPACSTPRFCGHRARKIACPAGSSRPPSGGRPKEVVGDNKYHPSETRPRIERSKVSIISGFARKAASSGSPTASA
jgi:hypothetical protein